MSGTAKFFVVVNLVLSLLYLGATAVLFGYREDFKTKYIEEQKIHKDEVDARDKEIASLKAEVDTRDNEINTQTGLIKALEGKNLVCDEQNKKLSRQLDDLQAKVNSLEASYSDLKTTVDQKDNLIKNLTEERDKSRRDYDAARKEKEIALAERTKLQSENTKLQEQLANLEKNFIDLAKKTKEQEIILEDLLKKGVDIAPVKVLAVSGKVSAVRADWRLVMINVGQKDGVRKGMAFVVSRGPQYIGKIMVDEIYPDMAAGTILGDQTPITPEVGDDVRATQ